MSFHQVGTNTTTAAQAEVAVCSMMSILKSLLVEDGLTPPAYESKCGRTRQVAHHHLEVLQGEAAKLRRREAVLAVVGTMKAGKSTTINAIVGTDVLPTRNRPMTMLPTLIRHRPNQCRPLLRFDNQQPIENLMEKLRTKLTNLDFQERRHWEHTHFSDLLRLIDEERGFKQQYEGAEAIAAFLRGLNDLARLAGKLDISFPFSDYNEIHKLPVIDVKFSCLPARDDESSSVALLDTPGPNEDRQPHLRRMLKDQLAQASAILLILDNTQLQSTADAGMRKDVAAIKDLKGTEVYALVNKFDQRGSQDYDPAQVRSLVAEELLANVVTTKQVFPASAEWAHLSLRATEQIHMPGGLKESDNTDWVIRFSRAAFGEFGGSKIKDANAVLLSAKKLWDDSEFNAVLDVIQAINARSESLIVQSATAKLDACVRQIQPILASRGETGTRIGQTALAKLEDRLHREVEGKKQQLIGDIREIISSQRGLDRVMKKHSKKAVKKVMQVVHSVRKVEKRRRAEIREIVRRNLKEFQKEYLEILESNKGHAPMQNMDFRVPMSAIRRLGTPKTGQIFSDILDNGRLRKYGLSQFSKLYLETLRPASRTDEHLTKLYHGDSGREKLGLAVLACPDIGGGTEISYRLHESAAHWLILTFADINEDIRGRVIIPLHWEVATHLSRQKELARLAQ